MTNKGQKAPEKKERFPRNILESDCEDNISEMESTNGNTWQLSVTDLMKDAQRIHEFRGDNSYALTSFLREVDTLLPLFNGNPQLKQYVFHRTIINKIQGRALDVMQTVGNEASWDEIKRH